jgi:hypothetical protein
VAHDEFGRVEPEPGQLAGAEVLQQHIGRGDQRGERLLGARVARVDRQRALAGALHHEALAQPQGGQLRVGRLGADHVVGVGALDADHLGAQQAELIAREGTGEHVRPVDHAQAGQRAGGGVIRV